MGAEASFGGGGGAGTWAREAPIREPRIASSAMAAAARRAAGYVIILKKRDVKAMIGFSNN